MTHLVTLVLAAGLGAAPDDRPPKAAEPPFAKELAKLQSELRTFEQEQRKGYTADLPENEKLDRVVREYEAFRRDGRPLVERALALVAPHAKDPAAVEALTWVLTSDPASAAAERAAELLMRHHLTDPRVLTAASMFSRYPSRWSERLFRALAGEDLPPPYGRGPALYLLGNLLMEKAEMPAKHKAADARNRRVMELFFGPDSLKEILAADPAASEAEAARLYAEVAEKYGQGQ